MAAILLQLINMPRYGTSIDTKSFGQILGRDNPILFHQCNDAFSVILSIFLSTFLSTVVRRVGRNRWFLAEDGCKESFLLVFRKRESIFGKDASDTWNAGSNAFDEVHPSEYAEYKRIPGAA